MNCSVTDYIVKAVEPVFNGDVFKTMMGDHIFRWKFCPCNIHSTLNDA